MSSTFTPNLNLELQATGDGINVWGQHLNNNVFAILDSVLGAGLGVGLTNTNVTLTTTQMQNSYFLLTGVLTANVVLFFQDVGRTVIVNNNTSGAFTVNLKTVNVASNSVLIPQGTAAFFLLGGGNISVLPNVTNPTTSVAGNIPMFADATGKILQDSGASAPIIASQPQAEAGTSNTVYNSPLRTAQQTTARIADFASAQAGTDNNLLMTPLRTANAIAVQAAAYPNQIQDGNQTNLPVGTTLVAEGSQNRAGYCNVYQKSADGRRYSLSAVGNQMTGNWLARGEFDGSTNYTLVQRVS